jgi:lipoprotein-anchoring transpeptidase ErfK/SrfK
MALPGGETRPIASVLRIEGPLRYGDQVWNTDGVPPGPIWVRVDLTRQILSVFRGGHEIGSAVILYGSEGKPTPRGRFHVLQKAADYHSRTYDAPMPFMLRLTDDGVAIHGSQVREGRATHGCIGLPEPFARRLFQEMALGDAVFVVA